jgi:uncharacterized protein YcfL
MKTHILLMTLAALFLTACASHEGRSVSSTQEEQKKEDYIFSRGGSSGGRDFGRQ